MAAVPKSKKLLQFTLDDGTGVERTILSGIHAFYEPEALVGKTLIAITNLPPRAMMGIESCGMLQMCIRDRAYSFDIALQNELTLDENIELAREFCMEQFVARGMIVDLAVHELSLIHIYLRCGCCADSYTGNRKNKLQA